MNSEELIKIVDNIKNTYLARKKEGAPFAYENYIADIHAALDLFQKEEPPALPTRPKLKGITDHSMDMIENACETYLNEVERGYDPNSEATRIVFETVLNAMYGAKVWDWIRSKPQITTRKY
jgi:hypothetical protein